MTVKHLLNDILAVLQTVKDDEEKLTLIHDFMFSQIFEKSPDLEEIPDFLKKSVHDIAESILCGFVCFFNPRTKALEEMPAEYAFDRKTYESETGELIDYKYNEWDQCITIQPMNSNDSFEIMQRFADTVSDAILQKQLTKALRGKRPFANFRNIVDDSDFKHEWFDFRQKQTELYVWTEYIKPLL